MFESRSMQHMNSAYNVHEATCNACTECVYMYVYIKEQGMKKQHYHR